MNNSMQITLEELYIVIGELEITRRKLLMVNAGYLKQIEEMSQEIDRLREENGRLDKAYDNK